MNAFYGLWYGSFNSTSRKIKTKYVIICFNQHFCMLIIWFSTSHGYNLAHVTWVILISMWTSNPPVTSVLPLGYPWGIRSVVKHLPKETLPTLVYFEPSSTWFKVTLYNLHHKFWIHIFWPWSLMLPGWFCSRLWFIENSITNILKHRHSGIGFATQSFTFTQDH